MKKWFAKNSFPGLLDVVLGYRSIAVQFDLYTLVNTTQCKFAAAYVSLKLQSAYEAAQSDTTSTNGKHITIPVCYHPDYAPDIQGVAVAKGITVEDVISLHSSKVYSVYLIGFLPGFPYLGFVSDQLEVPRKDSPRPRVAAGSVGVAGKQTGIYPLDSPGGWQIIGRTPIKLFDPYLDPPVLLEFGDTVSFEPITLNEFNLINKS